MSEHCFWHRDEQWPADGAYQFCFECGHAWPTREDFVADVRQMEAHLEGARPPADNLPFCPLCAHDF